MTHTLRPRGAKRRRAATSPGRRLRVVPPRLNKRQTLMAAGAVLLLGTGTAAHFFQLDSVHKLEDAAAEQALDPALAGPFHDDPVFVGPEWTAHQVMVSASIAMERLGHASDIESTRDSVWLPWLSGRAGTAAETYFAPDPEAEFTTEFTRVVAQTKAACEAPQIGLPVQSYIDSWAPDAAGDIQGFAGQRIPVDYASEVMTAAYRSAMHAGLTYLCPEAVLPAPESVPGPAQQDIVPSDTAGQEDVTDTL